MLSYSLLNGSRDYVDYSFNATLDLFHLFTQPWHVFYVVRVNDNVEMYMLKQASGHVRALQSVASRQHVAVA